MSPIRKPRGQRQPRQITESLVRDALSFIPPDCGHDERARLAFAVWDALGDAGADAWKDWASQRNGADLQEDAATWRSARKPGPVKVGTLFGVAKDHGFRFPEPDQDAPAPDPEALARAAAERQRQRDREEAEHRARADQAARDAWDLWTDARDTGASPYLARKGVQGYGVRYLADSTLLVPMRDAEGRLKNVQRIAPQRPADGSTDKRFMPGGRKSGLRHLIGPWPDPTTASDTATADQAEGTTSASPAVILAAEGYATGASLLEATGLPVAVCFDAGNLKHVVKDLRQAHPAALVLICGDDDVVTAERTGTNPGRVKAAQAMRAAATTGPAGTVFPVGLPAGASDFNDLHAHAGLDAVRDQVQAAVLTLLAGGYPAGGERADAKAGACADVCTDGNAGADPAPWADSAGGGAPDGEEREGPTPTQDEATAGDQTGAHASASPSASKSPKGRKSRKASAAEAGAGDGSGDGRDGGPDLPGFDRFRCDESGVWYTPPAGPDGESGGARRVCDRLDVLALARDANDRGGAFLLEFVTRFGGKRRWLMPLAMLAGDGVAYRSELQDMGFRAPIDANRRRWLSEYLQTREPDDLVRLVDCVGWSGRSYVLPRETLAPSWADDAERLMFHSEAPADDNFKQRGTLEQWQQAIGRYCVGNTRMTFAVGMALAGPVLYAMRGMESGGANLMGSSSTGKSTALKVAASVFGAPAYRRSWRATGNGLEAVAAMSSDALLVLDEIAEIDPKEAGATAYMLSAGRGKTRAGRNGGNRPSLTWRLLWLSAGEIPLAQHMAEAGKKIRAGQELRMVDVPADPGAGLGLFDTVHDQADGAALSAHLSRACESLYGTLGRAWIQWLVDNSNTWPKELREHVEELGTQFVPAGADGQVQRAGKRFALAAAAGELATRAGLTGWPAGEAIEGARACFLAWANARPAGFGNSEQAEAIRQVRAQLEKNGDALFTWAHRLMDDRRANTAMRYGIKRMVDDKGHPVKYDGADEYCDTRAPDGSKIMDHALVEYLVFPEAFKTEVCKGLNPRFVADVLKEAGYLRHDPGTNTRQVRLPGLGDRLRVFNILPAIMEAEE